MSRYQTDPAYRARVNARSAAWFKAKCAADPEYHEMVKARRRAIMAANPEYREKRKAQTNTCNKIRRAAVPKEHVIEKYLVDAIAARGGFCPKFIDGGRRGAPDRLVILPGHPAYFVELKRPKMGQLQPWQRRYHEDLRACDQKVWVLSSIEMVDEFLLTL
jgi:hypothetical protein